MRTKKKLLTGLMTLVMVLSLMYLPGGVVVQAESSSEQSSYILYFDADEGKIYKETEFTYNSENDSVDSWTPKKTQEYVEDDFVSCSGNELILHNFSLIPANTGIVIKGNAVLRLDGENVIKGRVNPTSYYVPSRCGVYAFNDLSVVGEGSLSIDTVELTGIYVGGDLTVKNATIDSLGGRGGMDIKGKLVVEAASVTARQSSLFLGMIEGGATSSTYGIQTGSDITVKNGVLRGLPTSGSARGISAGGNIEIENGTLEGSAPSSLSSRGVNASGSIKIKSGTLKGSAAASKGPTTSTCSAAAIYAGSNIQIEGGAVEGTVSGNRDNVLVDVKAVHADGSIEMNGGTLKGEASVNTANSGSAQLRTVYAKGDIVVNGGILESSAYSEKGIAGDSTRAFYAGGNIKVNGGTLEGTACTENSNKNVTTQAFYAAQAIMPGDNEKVIGGSAKDALYSAVKFNENGSGRYYVDSATAEACGYIKFTTSVSGIGSTSPSNPNVEIGGSVNLEATVIPENASNQTIKWTSSDDTIASVDENGKVTGHKPGTVTITATAEDGGYKKEFTVTVSSNGPDDKDPVTPDSSAIMNGLNVSYDIANQILNEAAKLGVSTDTLLITEASIKGQKSDADLKGSTFGLLKARTTNLKKNSVTIKWDKVKNADGYILYGNKCGKKNAYKHIKTFTKNSTVKYTQKKLKKGTYYKYLVVAYKNIEGVKVTIAASKTVHATTKGGKYGVAKSVKVNKKSKKLAVSKTFKIKASEVKLDKKIRQHRGIKYESDNSNVATVDKKGVVKAKQKGTCYIYVYAQNGVYKRIKITVK
ncbi:MAG: Ig-like domain-containing protein [Lachnospiraceae bacterium]|nr:Ig-like domain-containing protein [Lachnospiraceae bacterium]